MTPRYDPRAYPTIVAPSSLPGLLFYGLLDVLTQKTAQQCGQVHAVCLHFLDVLM